ncbi:MAG: hypothetical protein LAT75_08280 [Candidatus Cyclonatronum sp.]|uniref:hypothetical protein n=1 Tax=Cyclonatronum sp. TaxID=3024185 RepID=UPI0025C538CA|nr:hypothetical protein [Cyclonatronum sp.]MCH8486848.1 hypothetical protein [Cyclonatronum sp.]
MRTRFLHCKPAKKHLPFCPDENTIVQFAHTDGAFGFNEPGLPQIDENENLNEQTGLRKSEHTFDFLKYKLL